MIVCWPDNRIIEMMVMIGLGPGYGNWTKQRRRKGMNVRRSRGKGDSSGYIMSRLELSI